MHQQFVLAANKTISDATVQSLLGGSQGGLGAMLAPFLHELVIFAVTTLLALAIRGGYIGGKAKKPCSAAKPQRSSSQPLRSPSGRAANGGAGGVAVATGGSAAMAAAPPGLEHPAAGTPSPLACIRAPLNPQDELLGQRIAEVVRCANGTQAPEKALALYAAMRASGQHLRIKDSAKLSGHSPLEFYGTLIRCAGRTEQSALLEQILDDMALAGIARPRGVHETVMKLLAGKGHYRQALAVYDRMKADGIAASPVTLSCLSSFAAELNEFDLSLSFFETLATLGTPSIRAYMTVLRVHAARQDWPRSREIFQDMQRRGVTVDSLVLNIILSTGVATGELEAARQLLEETHGILCSPVADVVSYNTVIKGYAQSGSYAKALSMLEAMTARGVLPNAITFNTTIDAAVRASKTDDAWRVLAQMRAAGISPDKFTCSILMKSLSSGATAEQIIMVLEMTQKVRADPLLLGNLFRGMLEAAAKLRGTSLLMRIFTQMRTQRVYLGDGGDSRAGGRNPRGRPGRPIRTGTMLRLPLATCVQAGRFEEAVELLAAALELGVTPPVEAVEPLMDAVQRRGCSPLFERLQTLVIEYGLPMRGIDR